MGHLDGDSTIEQSGRQLPAEGRRGFYRELTLSEINQFFELSPNIYFILNREYTFSHCNRSAECLLGYSVEDLCLLTLFDVVHTDDQAIVRQQLEQMIRENRRESFTVRCIGKDRQAVWLEWIVEQRGEEGLVYASARDVTQKRVDEQLSQARSAARAVLARISPREQQVLRLVVDGLSNKAIASELGLSEKTIERHRSQGMRKLQMGSVADLVKFILLADS